MAIKKPVVNDKGVDTGKTPVTVPAFSFSPNDALAQMIVEAWSNDDFRNLLLKRDPADGITIMPEAVKAATDAVNAAGFNLERAVVISEAEHDADYVMQKPFTEVVFVLPRPERLGATVVPGKTLLDTARILMACTPNGI